MTGRVVHFEVPYDDAERARAFYGEVFGWKIQPIPEMSYDIVSTGPAKRCRGGEAPRWRRSGKRVLAAWTRRSPGRPGSVRTPPTSVGSRG